MAFVPNLTQNAVPEIVANNLELKPVLQCIGSKVVSNPLPNASERWRLALSDGTHWCTAMLASQLNDLVRSGELVNGTVLRLNEYLNQVMQGKMIIIILHVDIFGHKPRIGNPQGYGGPSEAEQVPSASNNQQNGLAPSMPRTAADLRGGPANDQAQPYGGNTAAGGPPTGGYGAQPNNSYQNSGYGAGAGYGQGTYGQPPQAPLAGGPAQGYGAPPAAGGGYGFGGGGGGYGQGQYTGGYGQAPAFRANNSAIARNEAAPKIVPIASLNAYQNRWTIKARVTQRSDIRRYNNAKGEGKFFTVDLLDAQGGEIRAISFNDVADKFDPILQMGAVVTISKASLKPKKPGSTYNQTRHDHEITMEKQTVVELVEDDQNENEIPQIQYHLRKIEEVEGLPATTVLDVLGVVEFVAPGATITRKDGTEAQKRNLTIRDDSNRSIELTLWGNYAANPGQQLEAMLSSGERPILAAKSVRVGDFSGKTLSSVGATLLTVNPDLPDAARLRNWFDNQGGAHMQVTKLSENRGSGSSKFDRRCTIAAIKDEGLGTNAQPAYVQVLCWITLIKQESKMCYPACPLQYNGRPCNKKLTNQGDDDNTWFCDRCQQNAQPDWRYILAIQADDHTGHIWLTAFQESGLEIMGMPAADLRDLEANNLPAFEALMLSRMHRPYLFKVKVAEDTYNDETRIKTNIMRAEPVDFVKESRVYLDYICKIQRGEPAMPSPAQPVHMGGGYQSGPPMFGAGGGGGGFAAQGVQGGYGSNAGGYGSNAGGNPAGGYGNGGYGNQNGRGKYGAGGF